MSGADTPTSTANRRRRVHRPDRSRLHFDLMCPFAYQTSVWIRRVREQTDLTINWKFFSLEEVQPAARQKHPWGRGGRTGGR
ncbi:MAG: hypothetical protein R2705_21800 [Ilumatobacteraceae bacterium]